MKIQDFLAAAILPGILLFNAANAQAQRKNTTSHDVKPVELNATTLMENDAQAPDNIKEKKHHKNKHKKDKCECKGENKSTNCDCPKKEKHDKHKNKMNKHHQNIQEESEEINQAYLKAIKKIQKSDFNDEQKVLLTMQAEENKNLALKQLQERGALNKKHMQQRAKADFQPLMKEKANKKAVKKVDDID